MSLLQCSFTTAMSKSKFIAVRNQADSSTLELYFLDVICDTYDWWTGMVYSQVQVVIDQVNAYRPAKIKVVIDSEGGDAQTGLSIYNFLKRCDAKVEVEIIGLAGSIASVIAMSANKGKLRIARNAFMMIHKAEGSTWGTSDDLRAAADLIDMYTAQIVDIYAQRTGKSVDEINKLIKDGDYWMTGEDCVSQGFADETFNEVTQDLKIAARLNTSVYKNIPAQVQALLKPTASQEDQGILSSLQNQFQDMKKFFTEIVNAIRGVKPAEDGKTPITNQIAEAISQPFEKLGDEIETTITNQLTAAFKDDKVTAIINSAVETAVKPFEDRIKGLETAKAELEKKNGELEQEIANNLGKPSSANKNEDGPKPIGGFSGGK
jgi:ATP-dependent protease ClpP protease subunit